MSFDRAALAEAVARHRRVARVLVLETAGSVPRDAGTEMLVWADGQSGTIGGGALEWQAAADARTALADGDRLARVPLGPDLGQCCGGAVTLLTEVWDAARLAATADGPVARPLPGGPVEPPLAVTRHLARLRDGREAAPLWQGAGWVVETQSPPRTPLWIWGAGHVGRAIAAVAAPLPGFAVTLLDTAPERFPDPLPGGVTALPAPDLPAAVALAPPQAAHLVLTYSHALDLELCHRLLHHGFGFAGLIGSATKRARFRSRLGQLGHTDASIARIACPIGDPALGKHPQAIAVGVVSSLISRQASKKDAWDSEKDRAG